MQNHPVILRPEGLDALGDIAVINVAAVDFEKITQRRRIVARAFERRSELIMEDGPGFLVQARDFERLFIPTGSDRRLTFIEKTLCQPCVGLDHVRERVSAIYVLADLLEFA